MVLSELFQSKVGASLQTYHFTLTMIMTKISCRGDTGTVISLTATSIGQNDIQPTQDMLHVESDK